MYSIIEDVVCKVYFQKTDVEAKQLWIYAALLMSVGPVGPGGGVYSIVEVVVYKVYFKKNQIWEPNNHGYIQLCLCLWALSGPEVGYIQL